jgi:NADH-quinone oxidoreductase subunit E
MPLPLPNRFDRVCKILDDHDRNPAHLIPILQAVQDEYRYLPEEIMVYVATSLGLPPARVYGVATFYSHFALEPRGKYIIRLCDGTACHVKASIPILEALQRRLDLTPQRKTTPDLRFTLETVSCLGACGLAPVLVINEEVYGQVTPARAIELVEALIAKESPHVTANA